MIAEGLLALRILRDGREASAIEVSRCSANGLRRGDVYLHLAKLEEQGYLESRLEPSGGLMLPRKLYRITEKGAAYLRPEAA